MGVEGEITNTSWPTDQPLLQNVPPTLIDAVVKQKTQKWLFVNVYDITLYHYIYIYILFYKRLDGWKWKYINKNKIVWAYNLGTPQFIAILKRKRMLKRLEFQDPMLLLPRKLRLSEWVAQNDGSCFRQIRSCKWPHGCKQHWDQASACETSVGPRQTLAANLEHFCVKAQSDQPRKDCNSTKTPVLEILVSLVQ